MSKNRKGKLTFLRKEKYELRSIHTTAILPSVWQDVWCKKADPLYPKVAKYAEGFGLKMKVK